MKFNESLPMTFEGKRYDVGEKLGFILTTIEFALKDETLKDKVVNFLEI